jgi:hypothetical protein
LNLNYLFTMLRLLNIFLWFVEFVINCYGLFVVSNLKYTKIIVWVGEGAYGVNGWTPTPPHNHIHANVPLPYRPKRWLRRTPYYAGVSGDALSFTQVSMGYSKWWWVQFLTQFKLRTIQNLFYPFCSNVVFWILILKNSDMTWWYVMTF